ncbi:hypothetical protein BCEP27_100042 [Burkholderia cepacia]
MSSARGSRPARPCQRFSRPASCALRAAPMPASNRRAAFTASSRSAAGAGHAAPSQPRTATSRKDRVEIICLYAPLPDGRENRGDVAPQSGDYSVAGSGTISSFVQFRTGAGRLANSATRRSAERK